GLKFLPLVARLVPVEHLDVVISVGATDAHADGGKRDDREHGGGEAVRDAREAAAQREIRPARPQQVSDDREDHSKAEPVELEESCPLPEASLPDEVAQPDVGPGRIIIERVPITHVAEEDAGDEP